ncbi:MAG TPA: hypothetical protein PKA64_02025 [Myxococcota bacterium]|nr:hypothetical protein [Myxococcota bacterium]
MEDAERRDLLADLAVVLDDRGVGLSELLVDLIPRTRDVESVRDHPDQRGGERADPDRGRGAREPDPLDQVAGVVEGSGDGLQRGGDDGGGLVDRREPACNLLFHVAGGLLRLPRDPIRRRLRLSLDRVLLLLELGRRLERGIGRHARQLRELGEVRREIPVNRQLCVRHS